MMLFEYIQISFYPFISLASSTFTVFKFLYRLITIANATAASAAAKTITKMLKTCPSNLSIPPKRLNATKFKFAEFKTQLSVARIYIDECINKHLRGDLDAVQGAMAKLWTTDLQWKVIDECVQLHGGYGYMREYPIAKAYEDARVQRIYGGTNEIMKEIISRTL